MKDATCVESNCRTAESTGSGSQDRKFRSACRNNTLPPRTTPFPRQPETRLGNNRLNSGVARRAGRVQTISRLVRLLSRLRREPPQKKQRRRAHQRLPGALDPHEIPMTARREESHRVSRGLPPRSPRMFAHWTCRDRTPASTRPRRSRRSAASAGPRGAGDRQANAATVVDSCPHHGCGCRQPTSTTHQQSARLGPPRGRCRSPRRPCV